MDNESIWRAVLGEVELSLSRANFITWFKDTFISSFKDGKVTICIPNAFAKRWLEQKCHKQIKSALEHITGSKVSDINYKIEIRKHSDILIQKEKENNETIIETIIQEDVEKPKPINSHRSGLNPKYLFENFVVGKGNELAHAACRAVLKDLGKAYNPLFIYGGVGLGKTHLLQALGNEALKHTDKVLYITSENFTNHYIQAIQSGKAKEFKNRYRNVDILLIDDVQFMGGKDGTQEEFFHTFNQLKESNKQIVLTSDRPPQAIPAIEKRLISRFQSGMVADVGKLDVETKVAILQKIAKEKNFDINEEVLMYIADNIRNNIRELEGALNRVIVFNELNNTTPEVNSTKNILSDILTDIQLKSISAKDILEAVTRFYDITLRDLIGKSRKKELVAPRQIAIYLMREELRSSYPAIGNELGGRDHTTAMHGYNKVAKELKNNERLNQEIKSIKSSLQTR